MYKIILEIKIYYIGIAINKIKKITKICQNGYRISFSMKAKGKTWLMMSSYIFFFFSINQNKEKLKHELFLNISSEINYKFEPIYYVYNIASITVVKIS